MRPLARCSLLLTAAFAASGVSPAPPNQSVTRPATDDYQEECLNEGCNAEEVEELYESYQEECLNEGCSPEEVFELGGTTQGVLAMKEHFIKLGKRIDEKDFRGVDPFCEGTTTKCAVVVLFCNDHCNYPDGSKSGWYPCGGCIGFDWW